MVGRISSFFLLKQYLIPSFHHSLTSSPNYQIKQSKIQFQDLSLHQHSLQLNWLKFLFWMICDTEHGYKISSEKFGLFTIHIIL